MTAWKFGRGVQITSASEPSMRFFRSVVRQRKTRVLYERNQLVSALMAHVRSDRAQAFLGNLAVVHVPSRFQPLLLPEQERIILGAKTRARELGFEVGVFTLGKDGTTPATLARVLQARGILGAIFLQPNSNDMTAGFPWENFAALQIDYDSPNLVQHTVSLDHHFTLIASLARLQARGYRRIGLFIARHKDARLVHKWSAAFRSYQENKGGIGRVPVYTAETITRTDFMAWYRSHRPDLVIGHRDAAVTWLRRAGVGVPREVGFFNLNWNERTRPCAGLDLQPELHGVVAVETLAAQIHRNERGLPTDPRTVMISGRWIEGPTLRPAAG